MAHTPGPWMWDDEVPQEYDNKFFDDRAPWLVREGDHPVEGQILTGQIVARNSANLPLIAAAPELLEALKLMLAADIYSDGEGIVRIADSKTADGETAVKAARDAIAKAEGRL